MSNFLLYSFTVAGAGLAAIFTIALGATAMNEFKERRYLYGAFLYLCQITAAVFAVKIAFVPLL